MISFSLLSAKDTTLLHNFAIRKLYEIDNYLPKQFLYVLFLLQCIQYRITSVYFHADMIHRLITRFMNVYTDVLNIISNDMLNMYVVIKPDV